MHRLYIGIDNGVTGTIAWMDSSSPDTQGRVETKMVETPVFSEQSYTREKKNISRIDTKKLEEFFSMISQGINPSDILVVIERPMVNPMRFAASCSALRALEATLIIVERFGFARMYCDSRAWQKKMLPQGCKGDELKRASEDIGLRLFPSLEKIITKHTDADALLIAEWARREGL